MEGPKSPVAEQRRGRQQTHQTLLLSCEAQRHVLKAIEERLGLQTTAGDKREGSVHLELLSVLMRVVEALISTRSYWQAPAYPTSPQASFFSFSQPSSSQDPSPCIPLLPENGKVAAPSSFSSSPPPPRVYTPLALSTFLCAFICEAMRCFSFVASIVSQLSLQSLSTDKTKGSSLWAPPHSPQTTVKVETVAHSISSPFASSASFYPKDLVKVGMWKTSTWSALHQVAQESKYEGTPLGKCAKALCQWFTQLDLGREEEREETERCSPSSPLSFSPSFLFDVALCLLSGAAASSPYLLPQSEDLRAHHKESLGEKAEEKRKEDDKKIEGSVEKGIMKKEESNNEEGAMSRLTLLTIKAFQLKQMEELLDVGGTCIYSAAACYDGGEPTCLSPQRKEEEIEKKEKDEAEGKREKTPLSSKTVTMKNSEDGEMSSEVLERTTKKNEANVFFNFCMKKLLAWVALLQRQLAGALAAEGKVGGTPGSCLSPLSTDNGEGAIAALAALTLLDELSQDADHHIQQQDRRFAFSSKESHLKGAPGSSSTDKGDTETPEETSRSSSSSSSCEERDEKEDVVGHHTKEEPRGGGGGEVPEWGPSLSLLRRKAIAAVVSEGIDIQTLTSLHTPDRASSSSSFTGSSLIASLGGQDQHRVCDQASQGEDRMKKDAEEKSSASSSSQQGGENSSESKGDKVSTDSSPSSSSGLEKDQDNVTASSSSEGEETGRRGETTSEAGETAEALILDALVETLKEEEQHLVSLASRVQEQAQRYTSEEPTSSLSTGGGGGEGKPSSMNLSSENEDPSHTCLQNNGSNGFELLSPDLQADLVYFFHSTIPFLSRVSRETTALGASSVSFSSSSISSRSACQDEERSIMNRGGSKKTSITSPEFSNVSSSRSSSHPTPLMTPPTSLLAMSRPLPGEGVSLDPKRGKTEKKRKSTLLSISPILESYFLRLTSLYGDIFSLLALRTSRTLDAPLVSCLGMAVNPNYPMEPVRRQRYGVDDSFLLAITCSLPVFLSCLKVFRLHSHGAGLRERTPCVSSDLSFSSSASPSQAGIILPLPSSSSMAATPATPSGRTGGEDGEETMEREHSSTSTVERGSFVSSPSSVIVGDEKETGPHHPDHNSPSGLQSSSVSACRGRDAGNGTDSYRAGAPHQVAQQVLPTLDTPFCVWGVAVPPNRSTAKWLVKGQELQMEEDGEDEDEEEEEEDDGHSSLFDSTCASSSAGGTPTANGKEASIFSSSPAKRHRQSLSSSQTQGDEDKRSEASIDRRGSPSKERRGREDLPDEDFSSSSSTGTTTSKTTNAPPADGCYLHSTASRLCIALGAFILTELVAVSAFCSCCTAAVEKKKYQFLPAAAGIAAVTAGGGAGGAGAAASAALALATMAARRGSAWRDLCFSGQLARWCLHSLLLLIGAPLEAIATGREEKETAGPRERGEKRMTTVSEEEERPGHDDAEELHWQLHPLTGILPVLEDEDSCVMDISCFRDPSTPMSTLDDGGGGPLATHSGAAASTGAPPASGVTPARGSRAASPTPTSSKTRGGGGGGVSETSISTPTGSSLSRGSPSGGRGGTGVLIGAGDDASSLFLDTLSPVSAVLSGALGDAVVGRNEERGALDGGEYAARLGQLVWSALEVEMLVRELGDGAGSSQLEGLMGLATGGERSGAIGSTGGKALLPSESKSKKGERGERAAKAASAAPAPVALVPEWLRNACREEYELPWERKLSGINVYAPAPRPTTGGSRPGVISDRASSLSQASSGSGKRQFPGLELYLPGGVCSSSLPLAALQLCLRVMRISCVRGFEQELLVCASAAVCSSSPRSNFQRQGEGGEEKALSPYTLDGPEVPHLENSLDSLEKSKQEKGGDNLFSKSLKSRIVSSSLSYGPDAERATTMMTQALRQKMSENVQERKEEEGGGEIQEEAQGNRTSLQTSPYEEEAIAEFAPFTTISGSNVFLVIPLAARLLQVQRAATALTEEMSYSRAAGVWKKPSPSSISRKTDMISNTPERKDDEDDGTRKTLRKERQGKKWCWAASEVSDRLGDIAHCIACCYFLVYGQPVLRPTPPLDKLVMKTTKEQMRSNFVEGSLPAAILGVYIHRAVQRCAPWATERPSKGKPLSISTFLFPSRETREFGRSAIAASDTLLFNSPSPPEVSVPSYLPPFLHLPSSTCLSPLPFPYPPGLTFSLFWSHAADPLVLPRYLHLFLLLSVQQLQLSQPLQIPLQMQQILQQQIDGASSSFQSQQEVALLRPLPSLRSICHLIEPSNADEASKSDISKTTPPWVARAYLKSIASTQEISSDQRGNEGVWRTGLSSSSYGYSEQTEEDLEVRLRCLAKVEGGKKFIHQANPTSLGVAPLYVYTPYSQHIYKLHLLQTLLLLHFIPSSKHQSLLDAYWPPSTGGDRTEPKSFVSSEEEEGKERSSSLTSLPCPLFWYSESNSGVGAMKDGSRGDEISEKESKESIARLQDLLHARLLYRGKASDHIPSDVHDAPSGVLLLPSFTPDRLPYGTVISISRVLAASALSAVGQRPLHGSPPSLRGFSLHLLQLLQQSQRTASTEVEALERVGLAARTAALAPANPSLWTSLACLLLEVVLLLLDKHAAAGGGGLLTGFGGGHPSAFVSQNKLFNYMRKGALEENQLGHLPPGSLHTLSSSLNTSSLNFSGKTAVGGNTREFPRNGGAGGGGGGKSSMMSMSTMTGKKGTTAAAVGDLASSTSSMVSVLWRYVGCPGDKAAPCEEILLQLFAHACLVSNLCGEIWLAAMKRFNALKEVNIDMKSRFEMVEAKTATTRENIWEKLNVAILSSSWWSKMKQSSKKIDDPAELQWRFVVARLDALLLVVLLWKHFRYTNNQTMTSRRPYAAIAADLHRQRWTAGGGDSKDKTRSNCLFLASLFAKAPLGSRGDGSLSELQKLLLGKEKNREGGGGEEEDELNGGQGGQDHPTTVADSKKSSSKKNILTSSQEEEEEAKQMLAVLESEGDAGQSLPQDSSLTEDYDPSTRGRRGQGYLIAVPTVEDVRALRSFIVEASGLLRFVYDARALALTAAAFNVREDIVSKKTETLTHNNKISTPSSSPSKEETSVSSIDTLSTGGSAPSEGRKLFGVEKLGDEDGKEVWRWTSTASLSRCKMWVDAETFLWPLPLMRSKWLARLAQWTIQLPAQYKDLVRLPQGEITGVLAAIKSVCNELTHAARHYPYEDAEEVKILSQGGRGEGEVDVVMMNGDGNERQDEEEKKSNSQKTSLLEEGEKEREEGEEKRLCGEDRRLCIASVFYASALCDASDALMMSCIQAFGAEAMLDPSSVEAQMKDTSERQNKRRKTEKAETTRESSSSSEGEVLEREKDPSMLEKKDKEGEATTTPAANSCEPEKKKKNFVSARVSLRHYYEALTDMEELVEADGDVLPLAMPLYHLHALRLKVLVASKGALWKVAALFPWKKSHGGEEKREQQEAGDRNTQGDNRGFDKRLDRLIRHYLRGEKDRDIKTEFTRLRSRQQLFVSVDHEKEEEQHEENQETKEDLDILRPFSSPADVVADCIEVLQYLALKSRQAGLWTSIPRLLLVDAALISGHASLALRHLRHLYARGCPKLLPPDAWLSNHYQALKQRRPAYDRSKLRLYLATSAAVVLLAKFTLKRTEKKKEEQLTRFRAEDVQEKSGMKGDGGGKDDSSSTSLSADANTSSVVAGEGWIYGGLEKIETLDEVVQGVKLIVEQLDAQLKLLRRVQLLQLQNELQLGLIDDPSSPPRPGSELHSIQSQVLQLQNTQGGPVTGSGGGAGTSSTILDEDAQQTNSEMQAEVVRSLLDGAVTVFETLVMSCPDVLDMREMHRAITQLFPDVGVPEVEPQNTYDGTTASIDGRLLRLLRDAVVAIRGAAPQQPMQLLRKLRSLRTAGAGATEGRMTMDGRDEAEVISIEHALEELQTRLETAFVMACRKLLYHNPPVPCPNPNEENKDQTAHATTPTPGVAVMKLSLGLPVRCGMEVQEIEKAKEALAAFGKATRAGAPSMELFLKSGKVSGGGGGESVKKGRPSGTGRSAGQRGGPKGDSGGGQETANAGAVASQSSPDGLTASAVGADSTQRGGGGAKRGTTGEADAPGAAAPGENKRRKTEEVLKVGETRPTGVQGAEATSGDLECVIEVE
ncbi:transmembrane protein [Cystoisospora suis]|uniref:Transmembrane protein n=1 Tax=Cystoisospora suis TaxID=483139 RepID=A0A2C6LED8_9APIC|nr:transmembrane protein [Cystoisospora suis]